MASVTLSKTEEEFRALLRRILGDENYSIFAGNRFTLPQMARFAVESCFVYGNRHSTDAGQLAAEMRYVNEHTHWHFLKG